VVMAIVATETEPLQKSEFFLKNVIFYNFEKLSLKKNMLTYFLITNDIINKSHYNFGSSVSWECFGEAQNKANESIVFMGYRQQAAFYAKH
jgi:hypothetical protein